MTAANAWLLTQTIHGIYQERIDRLVRLIEHSNFPLTTNVVEQLAQLSGAELIVLEADDTPRIFSSGIAAGRLNELVDSLNELGLLELGSPDKKPSDEPEGTPRGEPGTSAANGTSTVAPFRKGDESSSHRELRRVEWNGHVYFLAFARRTLATTRTGPGSTQVVLLLDAEPFDRLWLQSLAMPLTVAVIFLPIMAWIAVRLSRQVSQPIQEIQARLRTLAAGDLTVPAMQPAETTEIEELQQSLEVTAETLREREQTIRANEQMSALIQVGQGIAHNIKNAATACRLAIDLAQTDSGPVDPACLGVIRQQLASIDQYIERFLNQARGSAETPTPTTRSVELRPSIQAAIDLLKPRIAHARVHVEMDLPEESMRVTADPHDLEQLVMLLVQNAIDASTELHSASGTLAQVGIRARLEGRRLVITIRDNGPGPAADIRDRMFAPFASNKPEGTGLGLPEAQRIAERYNGTVRWAREDGWTCFEVSIEVNST